MGRWDGDLPTMRNTVMTVPAAAMYKAPAAPWAFHAAVVVVVVVIMGTHRVPCPCEVRPLGFP